jgi:hypothetical protein
MLDLYNNKYDRNTLKKHIYAANLMDILKTQTLDVSFIVRYILNRFYQLTDEDLCIDIETILKFQPHIQREQLITALKNYDLDDDSVEDFETYSKRLSK